MPLAKPLDVWTWLAPRQQLAVVEAVVQILLTEEIGHERIDQDRRT